MIHCMYSFNNINAKYGSKKCQSSKIQKIPIDDNLNEKENKSWQIFHLFELIV